jgi:hypothetical protein
MRSYRPHIRLAPFPPLLSVLLLVAHPASASPAMDVMPEEGVRLIREIALFRDSTLEQRLVRCIGTYGSAAVDDTSRAMMARDWTRFEPLLVTSMRPPGIPDEILLEWIWPLASSEGREGIEEALLAWLEPNLMPVLFASNTSATPDLALGRVIAARALAKRAERRAIPHLRALVEPAAAQPFEWGWDYSLGYRKRLELALQQLEDPRHAGYLVVDDRGRLEVRRRLSDIDQVAKLQATDPYPRGDRWMPVEPSRRLLDALRGAPCVHHPIPAPQGDILVLYSSDGLALRLWPLGRDTVAFDDNDRSPSPRQLPYRHGGRLLPPVSTAVISAQAHRMLLEILASTPLPPSSPTTSRLPRELMLPFVRDLCTRPTPAKERRFIASLGRASFWLMAFEPEARELMSRNPRRFGPLALRAQRPPFMPDRSLVEWTLEHSTPAQRDMLIRQLLRWLEPAPMLGGLYSDDLSRSLAADILVDLGVTRAAPMIKALLETGLIRDADHQPNQMWLRQSYQRLVDSSQAGVLVLNSGGGVAMRRSLSDVDRVWFGWYHEEPITATEARELWGMLASSHSRPESCRGHYPYGLIFGFRDGLEAKVFVSDEGELCYEDNSRPGTIDGSTSVPSIKLRHRARLRLDNPALAARLEEIRVRAKVKR